MVTRKRPVKRHIPGTREGGDRHFYVKEWRKFMGTSPADIAAALDIERQSYHRLEKNWWTISTGEQRIIAQAIGVFPSQLWFPPPQKGREVESLDRIVDDLPDELKQAAIMAVKGIASSRGGGQP